MRTLTITFILASFLAGVALSQGDEEKAEVKAMMQETSKGNDSPLGKISQQVKGDAPDWAELTKQAKQMKAMAGCLGECKEVPAESVRALVGGSNLVAVLQPKARSVLKGRRALIGVGA